MAASNLSENDVLIILGIGAFVMWNMRKKSATPVAVKSYPGQQLPINQIVPAAQANATANVWGAIGQGLSQLIGTSAQVAAVGIANTALQVPTPNGSDGGTIGSVDSSSDGAVLNPSGNLSAQDYVDNLGVGA